MANKPDGGPAPAPMTADEIAAMSPDQFIEKSMTDMIVLIDEQQVTITALTAELATERQARARYQDKCEGMAEQAEADQIKIEAQAAEIARMRGALESFADIGVGTDPDYQPMIRLDRAAILAARAALEVQP